jgi:hypothetical protein
MLPDKIRSIAILKTDLSICSSPPSAMNCGNPALLFLCEIGRQLVSLIGDLSLFQLL